MDKRETAEIIILAGGLGTRMQSELPKVLHKLHGKTLLEHVLNAVEKSGLCDSPVIVVGKKREMIMDIVGAKARYAIQDEQLGTGHAVRCAESLIGCTTLPVMVIYGDMPYITPETMQKLAETHFQTGAQLTMATVLAPDFNDWRAGFFDFGRVVRDSDGNIIKTVEKKDATAQELSIKEVNPCYFCFESGWLWEHLKKLENANAQKEYYLTDLVTMAVREGAKIASIQIDAKEALGVNTAEHLEMLRNIDR